MAVGLVVVDGPLGLVVDGRRSRCSRTGRWPPCTRTARGLDVEQTPLGRQNIVAPRASESRLAICTWLLGVPYVLIVLHRWPSVHGSLESHMYSSFCIVGHLYMAPWSPICTHRSAVSWKARGRRMFWVRVPAGGVPVRTAHPLEQTEA